MSKCLKFCAQGLKFEANFHSKMSVCGHELGLTLPTPSPTPYCYDMVVSIVVLECCVMVGRRGGSASRH